MQPELGNREEADIAYRAALSQEPNHELHLLNYARNPSAWGRKDDSGQTDPSPTKEAVCSLLRDDPLAAVPREELHWDLVSLAKSVIDWNCDIVATVREMVPIIADLDVYLDEPCLPIVGFGSETDVYPTGALRDKYDEEYLRRLDVQLADYLRRSKSWLQDACRAIVEQYEASC